MFLLLQKWEKRHPVSFTFFTNANFGTLDYLPWRNEESIYQCACSRKTLSQNPPFLESNCIDLSEFKAKSKWNIYPFREESHLCSLMLLTNLAEPEWVSVNCSWKLLKHILCLSRQIDRAQEMENSTSLTETQKCLFSDIVFHNRCYLLVWFTNKGKYNTSQDSQPPHPRKGQTDTLGMMNRALLFSLLKIVPKPIYLPHRSNAELTNRITYERFMNRGVTRHTTVARGEVEGFGVCLVPKIPILNNENVFQCSKGGHISILNVCDDTVDCPNDESDEGSCECHCSKIEDKNRHFCKTMIPANKQSFCSIYYFRSMDNSCLKYFTEEPSKLDGHRPSFGSLAHNQSSTVKNNSSFSNNSFVCNNGLILDISHKDDLVADCGSEAEDEKNLFLYLAKNVFVFCMWPYHIPCFSGHSKCYSIPDICVFKLNVFNHLEPCRNGAHLHLCKDFECNIKYKCLMSYCTPWNFVCDGKWDCPDGEDEFFVRVCGQKQKCRDMFKCRQTHLCIHLGELCDNKADCPMYDDELACDLAHKPCPMKCHCLVYAVHCDSDTVHITHQFFHFFLISIENAKIALVYNLKSTKSFALNLNFNGLDRLCDLEFPKSVHLLNLEFNFVQTVTVRCFSALLKLASLSLAHNDISNIGSDSFVNLPSLSVLDISNNPLAHLPHSFIRGSPHLKILSALNLSLLEIDVTALSNIAEAAIKTTDFHLCCLSPSKSHCTAVIPWYISCTNIFQQRSMRIICLVAPLVILVLNNMSILAHTCNKVARKPFAAFVVANNLNNIVLCFHYGIIVGADVSFDGLFVVKEKWWRSGIVCFLAFQLYVFYSLFDQLDQVSLSLSRLMVVIYPMHTKFKRCSFVIKICLVMLLSIFVLSLFATIIVALLERTVPTGLCLPFLDPTNSVTVIKILTSLTVFSQSSVCSAILALHTLLVYNLLQSQISVETLTLSKKSKNAPLFAQLVALTMSSMVCWIPVNIAQVTAMNVPRHPTKLVVWMTITVAPLNSVVYPLVLGGVSLKKCYKSRKGDAIGP